MVSVHDQQVVEMFGHNLPHQRLGVSTGIRVRNGLRGTRPPATVCHSSRRTLCPGAGGGIRPDALVGEGAGGHTV
jgi:hypothetical protein